MPACVDLLVVGAGPAGCAAALAARAHGLDVTVVDRARFPRDKTCGDGLTAAALAQLERLGVPIPTLPAATVEQVVLVAPDRWQVELPLPGPGLRAAVVERARLDAALLDRVRAADVPVHEGAAVDDVVDHDGTVTVRTAGGEERSARYVVAADGHYSAVRRRHGRATPDLGTWHAVRQYYGRVGDPRLWVLFEPDLLPGYAWVFPLPGGRANVGFGVLRGAGRDGKGLNARWRDLVRRPSLLGVLGPDAAPEGPHRAWPIPSVYSPGRLADGRVLYAGDAAGVVDPLTGEGIAQALETGALAAHAVAAGGSAAHVRDRYRRDVDRLLGRDLRFAAVLQRLLGSRRVTSAAIRAAGLNGWTRRNFARWMFEDYPRAAVFTPDRWQPGLLTPPGSFRATA